MKWYQLYKYLDYLGHSWVRLVMNSVIASMEIGFQVTISKSEVEMTSTLFSLVKNRSIMDLCFFSGFNGPIWAFEKSIRT